MSRLYGHRQNMFDMMVERPTGYRRANEPDDVLGFLCLEELPRTPQNNFSEEYLLSMELRIRYLVSHPDAGAETHLQAKQRLFNLLFRDYYEMSTVIRRRLYELKVSEESKRMECLDNLQVAIDDLCSELSPNSVQR